MSHDTVIWSLIEKRRVKERGAADPATRKFIQPGSSGSSNGTSACDAPWPRHSKKTGGGNRELNGWEIILNPAVFATEVLGFAPDAKQGEVLKRNAARCILNCSRQWGKSSITAIKALHQAVYSANSLTLVLSPSMRQSAEFIRKIRPFLDRLGMKARGDGQNQHSLLLENGSRIVGLPSRNDTLRGFSAVSLLLIDEAARVPDELYAAMQPTLACSNGDLWLLSTPNGCQGFFHRVWVSEDPEWYRMAIPAWECPRIRPAFLENQRGEMGERMFRQEYGCEFLEPEDAAISYECIEAAFDDSIEPLDL